MERARGSDRREAITVFSAPLDGAVEATLELRRARGGVRVLGARLPELCRATFSGRPPRASSGGGFVAVEYPRLALPRPRGATIEVNALVRWTLSFAAGIGDASLELGDVALTGLLVQGGASDVAATLPPPRGVVPVRVAGGATRTGILRPAGVATRLRVGHGASRLLFDEERYGAIGGETVLETPNARAADDRYEIVVEGGASRLTVGELPGGAR